LLVVLPVVAECDFGGFAVRVTWLVVWADDLLTVLFDAARAEYDGPASRPIAAIAQSKLCLGIVASLV
jgi:hypothetical protein